MTPLQKLSSDTRRYLELLNRFGSCRTGELLFKVDYWTVLFHRLQEYAALAPPGIRHLFRVAIWFLKPLVEGFTGARIRPGASIGPGLVVVNSFGVLIASNATIGSDCTIHSGVFVASKVNDKGDGFPVLGDRITLMAGCKVLGGVRIGDDVIVGANAVVISDVPNGCLATGVPAAVSPRCGEREIHGRN